MRYRLNVLVSKFSENFSELSLLLRSCAIRSTLTVVSSFRCSSSNLGFKISNGFNRFSISMFSSLPIKANWNVFLQPSHEVGG